MKSFIHEPAHDLPVAYEADLCVLGGSCTGVFAAIRAARLGLKVVIIEKQGCFGGVATASLVCVWHSFFDTEDKKAIIDGLTRETMERLERRGVATQAKRPNPSRYYTFNPEELKITLDEMMLEAGIKPYLHTQFCAPLWENDSEACGKLVGVAIENKSGRSAIRARFFIDATGDGDLAARAGCETYFSSHLQPATTCATISGWDSLRLETDYSNLLAQHGEEFGLPTGFAWGGIIPGSQNYMMAATRVYGTNPADADDLTKTEIEGRRQVRAILDLLKRYSPESQLALAALPSKVGLRESRHIHCHYQLTGDDVLNGRPFEDAIANGSYRVDVHHQDKAGITLQYLDGRQEYVCPGQAAVKGRWRPETDTNPTFYQIPFRSMLPKQGPSNMLVAGRMIDADPIAHAAIRVMVNMNQTGEAAGVAAALAIKDGIEASSINVTKLREVLVAGGSAQTLIAKD
jgi:hypothetical protein